MNGTYAFALAAGMAATVNPCGFALLPAYLSTFVGLDHDGGRAGAIGRASQCPRCSPPDSSSCSPCSG